MAITTFKGQDACAGDSGGPFVLLNFPGNQMSLLSGPFLVMVRLRVFFNPRSPRQGEADEGSRWDGAGGR